MGALLHCLFHQEDVTYEETVRKTELCVLAQGFYLVLVRKLQKDMIEKEHVIYFINTNTSTLPPLRENIHYTTINDVLDGDHFLYDKSGKLLSKSSYENGKLHGECIEYNVYVHGKGHGHTNGLKRIKRYICMYENGILISSKEEE